MGIIACLLFVLFSLGGVAASIWHFGTLDERAQADAIMVLGAAAWHNHPSPVFRERILHGVWLFEQGYAPYLIFTGGFGTGAPYSESHVARDYAIALGVPAEAILIEEHSRNTEDHFFYATDILNTHDISQVILVSDPLHMKRAVLMAQDAGLVVYSSPTPTTLYQTARTKLPFLKQEMFHYIGYRFLRLLP